ncbi:hypothetical protein PR048_021192 [Dryococelus australis]|uniref:Uncharacterized protein n=1 Tax=Dryococelus australis TaxID=614101 RepID=A0ABQ9GXK5_9NEOP|nr:hypothetical protein PR048_021192 [Dryococelus australis]
MGHQNTRPLQFNSNTDKKLYFGQEFFCSFFCEGKKKTTENKPEESCLLNLASEISAEDMCVADHNSTLLRRELNMASKVRAKHLAANDFEEAEERSCMQNGNVALSEHKIRTEGL